MSAALGRSYLRAAYLHSSFDRLWYSILLKSLGMISQWEECYVCFPSLKFLQHDQSMLCDWMFRIWWGDTSHLLGGWSGEQKDGALAKWKPTNEMVTATINFPIATGRLEDKRAEREKRDSSDNE